MLEIGTGDREAVGASRKWRPTSTTTAKSTRGFARRSDGGSKLTAFFRDVRSEMKRVTWPTQKEVYATTIVVILTSAFFGLYLFGVDLVLNCAVQRIFQRFGAA